MRGLPREVARRSIIIAVLAIPMIVVCALASAGRPFGGLSFGIYLAVAGLLVLCEQLLPFEPDWGSALKGNRTDVLYVIVAIVAFLFGLSGLLQHANVDSRSSVLNYVFATPEVHRAHHRADEASLTNFSAFFVLMDLLLGTYARPVRSEKPFRVGLDGVAAFPSDFLSHLTMPFRRDAVERRQPGIAAATLHGEP